MKSDISQSVDVKRLVDTFYERAGSDTLLSPVFSDKTYFSAHRTFLYMYWESTLLMRRANRDADFPVHIEAMFTPQHFIWWITIFLTTIDDMYSGPNAEKAKVIVIRKSEEFQASLEMFRF